MTEAARRSLNSSSDAKSTASTHVRLRDKSNVLKFFIAGLNGGGIVEQMLTQRGWMKILDRQSEDFNLAWTELSTQINYSHLKPMTQLVNHIPNNSILTNKMGLLLSLRNYDQQCLNIKKETKYKMDDFTPKTYVVDFLEERNEFINSFQEGDIWISKPVGANQGKGISLIRDITKFKTSLLNINVRQSNMWTFHSKIVQRYITNPLLIEGRKFDIRCYMLIASTTPYLVLFCPGYIRLSINQYSNGDDSLITHLTNQFVQKQSPQYDSVKDNTIWSNEKFNEYFNDNYSHLSNFKINWVEVDLTAKIKDILLHVFNSVKYNLANSVSYFELYGFDFMVDDNLQVWLIEANSNPSMSSNCHLLKVIIPQMIKETVYIALECFDRNTKSKKPLWPLEDLKKFQLIYYENIGNNSRRSSRIGYQIWNLPTYKSTSPLQKDQVSSHWKNYGSDRSEISYSMTAKVPKKDALYDRWNKVGSLDRLSLNSTSFSDMRPAFKKPFVDNIKSFSSPRSSRPNALSGDALLLSNAIRANFHPKVANKSMTDIIKRATITSRSSRNNDISSSTTIRSKLNGILGHSYSTIKRSS